MTDNSDNSGTGYTEYLLNDDHFIIRFAHDNASDKNGYIDLWKICFDDTQEFIDFFFSKRFIPEYSVCATLNGEIVSAMQSIPVRLWIRGIQINATIIAGVCTHPDFRGKGLMRQMIELYIREINKKNVLVTTYHPVDFNIYKSLGHLPTTDTLKYSRSAKNKIDGFWNSNSNSDSNSYSDSNNGNNDTVRPNRDERLMDAFSGGVSDSRYNPLINLTDDQILSAYALYSRRAPGFSGAIARTLTDFKLKVSDYISSAANSLFLYEHNALSGYCFFFESKVDISGEELITLSDDATALIIESLAKYAGNRKLTIKIPPDFGTGKDSIRTNSANLFDKYIRDSVLTPQNVLGVTELSSFIKAIAFDRLLSKDLIEHFVVEVIDPITSGNNARFDLSGNVSEFIPLAKVNIGYFVQFLCGYISALQLLGLSENFRRVTHKNDQESIDINKTLAETIDKTLGKSICFIVDEY